MRRSERFHPLPPPSVSSRDTTRIGGLASNVKTRTLDIFIFLQTDIFFNMSIPVCLTVRHARVGVNSPLHNIHCI